MNDNNRNYRIDPERGIVVPNYCAAQLPKITVFGSILVHFQQDPKQLVLLFGCLGRKKFITRKRDIPAAVILSTQLFNW